jgi:hypothetical protein
VLKLAAPGLFLTHLPVLGDGVSRRHGIMTFLCSPGAGLGESVDYMSTAESSP